MFPHTRLLLTGVNAVYNQHGLLLAICVAFIGFSVFLGPALIGDTVMLSITIE
jgi:hypothetical protein